jgi:hypothetical protein
LGVQSVKSFVNFKANAIEMGVLTVPLPFPSPPMTTRLQMDKFLRVGIRFKSTMSRTQIGIRESQCRDCLTAMGTRNIGAKDGMLQRWIHH